MSSWVRAGGGVFFLLGLFLSPLQWGQTRSAFERAAAGQDIEAMATFFGSLLLAGVAVVGTAWARRRVAWLDMLLAVASSIALLLFLWRYGQWTRGIALSWAGVLIVLGLSMMAGGSYGRYRDGGRRG